MRDQSWGDMLAKLNPFQLRRLRQEIDQALSRYESTDTTAYNHAAAASQLSFNLDRATYSSTASTLHDSGHSTTRASSICSQNPPGCESKPLYTPCADHGSNVAYRPECLDNAALYSTTLDTYPTRDTNLIGLHPQLETLHDSCSGLPTTAYPPATYAAQSNPPLKPLFFCTFCAEDGRELTAKTKQDWKRHEQDFHPGTGLEWHCGIGNCTQVFERGKDLKEHVQKNHRRARPPPGERRVQQNWVYGCGFENCRKLSYTWKDRCDHVARHMQEVSSVWSDWSYSKTIRNLLKDERLSGAWKVTFNRLNLDQGVTLSHFQWDPATTREMRQQLEGHKFGHSFEVFFESLFWDGYLCAIANGTQASPFPPGNFTSPSPFTTVTEDLSFESTSFTTPPEADTTDFPLLQSLGNTYQFDTADQVSTQAYRNSVFMSDAPPPAAPEAQITHQEAAGAAPPPGEELISFPSSEDFSANTAPPLAPTTSTSNNVPAPDGARPSARQRFMSKSRECLRSRFHQSTPTENPDVPLNMRIPKSSPRKKTHS